MPADAPPERARARQRARTRRDITEAVARLKKRGQEYSLEQVAEEAQISRATIYRYFPSLSALNVELGLAVRLRSFDTLVDPKDQDPLRRVLKIHAHLFDLVRGHESEFRAYLKNSMDQWKRNEEGHNIPLRGGRRVGLVESALAPLKPRLGGTEYEKLVQAVCLLTFFEPFIVLRDIFSLQDQEIDDVMRWALSRLLDGVLHANESGGR